MRPRLLSPLALALLFASSIPAQLVISVHSGLIHYSEGAVFIDDKPLQQKFGTFVGLNEGATLRTEEGRAEILLTPGVFLRVDKNSSIRMLSNALKGTRVVLVGGSAILDSLNATSASAVLVTYKDCQMRFPQKGVYRMDSDPPVLQAYNGEAEVSCNGKTSSVDASHLFFFSLALETQKLGDGDDDQFYQWSQDRSEFISADNQAAAQSAGDPGQMDSGAGIARDPDLYLGTPGYGGIPAYGLPTSPLPLDSAFWYANVPSGIGIWNMYDFYFIYLPANRRWPVRGGPLPVRIHNPGLPPSRIGISRPWPVRYPIFTPRPTVPRVGTIVPRYSPPPRPITVPRPSPIHVGATGMRR